MSGVLQDKSQTSAFWGVPRGDIREKIYESNKLDLDLSAKSLDFFRTIFPYKHVEGLTIKAH